MNSLADIKIIRNDIEKFAKSMTLFTIFLSSFLVLMAFPVKTSADLIPNPDPANYSDDIQGSGYFAHADQVFFEELLDVGPSLGLQGSEFGFFFAGADITDHCG